MFRSRIVTLLKNQVPSRGIKVEAKIAALGLKLPVPGPPKGNYVGFVTVGKTAFLAGHLPQPADGALVVGKVGVGLNQQQGKTHSLEKY